MAKRDAFSTTYPIKVRYQNADLADSTRLIGFQKMTEQAFREIERAVGDIDNVENAQNSILSDNPLYINSLGRALGSMANLIPPLSGVHEFSPTLAVKLQDATYNVIPHPDQGIKCEVGCKFDGFDPSDIVPARKCLLGLVAFYRQQEGSNTTICQTESCPGWSGRDGQAIEIIDCDPSLTSKTFREYKLVMPAEMRNVETFRVKYYSNSGASSYDKFRSDTGQIASNSIDVTNPSNNWALAINAIAVSGTSSSVQYDYPNLDPNNNYIVVIEVPALDLGQTILINNVSFGAINGTSVEPSRYLFDLSDLNIGTSISIKVSPATSTDGDQAAVSQVFIIEKNNAPHRNFGIPLLLPKAVDGLTPGTEIPPNFLQIFDTHSDVNRILDKTKVFAARFETPGPSNLGTNRDSFVVKIYDDQRLEVGNDRYLAVTVGMDVATTVGALLEAFIEHVSDPDLHVSEDRICQLLQDKTFCCTDSFTVQVQSLTPANKKTGSEGDFYIIKLWIYGGTAPYTITVDWDDNSEDSELGIVSGVQTFTLGEDRNPAIPGQEPFELSHQFNTKGTYDLSLVVMDDPDNGFGCTADISSQVSPFNVGSPPSIDVEVRLDQVTSYPNYIFGDIEAGYNFTSTPSEDFNSDNANYHVVTQIHNTDEEDGKPWIFDWLIENTDSLTYQFYYENVTQKSGETLSFINYSGTLAVSGFVQQDSLVLKRSNGQVLTQDVDYSVNWLSGTVTAAVGVSLGANESVTARYFHYAFMTRGDDPLTLSGQQWTQLNSPVNTVILDINVNAGTQLTTRKDINTIRFKVREPEV